MPLEPGQKIASYEILAPLGAGGMGEVYRARDTRLGRDVAIKALPEAFASDPERLARFEREARLLASLSHPQIAGKLLGTIPRLEAVAGMVAGQMQIPGRDLINGNPGSWDPQKIGAAILWAAVTFDRHVSSGRIPEQAAQLLNQAAPGLPPVIAQAMVKAISDDSGLVMSRGVTLRELEAGMMIDADVMSARGTRLVPRGTEVTSTVIERLRAVAAGVGVTEPIRVSVKVLD